MIIKQLQYLLFYGFSNMYSKTSRKTRTLPVDTRASDLATTRGCRGGRTEAESAGYLGPQDETRTAEWTRQDPSLADYARAHVVWYPVLPERLCARVSMYHIRLNNKYLER